MSACQKNLEEPERAAPSRISIAAGGVYVGHGADFSGEKPLLCSFRARKSKEFLRKLVGMAVAEARSPSTSLSKSFFDKLIYVALSRRPIKGAEILSNLRAKKIVILRNNSLFLPQEKKEDRSRMLAEQSE